MMTVYVSQTLGSRSMGLTPSPASLEPAPEYSHTQVPDRTLGKYLGFGKQPLPTPNTVAVDVFAEGAPTVSTYENEAC